MTPSPLPKFLLVALSILSVSPAFGQQINSLGIFSGITVPYTFDKGINKDPRYQIKYKVKFMPIGVHYGIDYDGFGFMIDPSIVQLGQHFNVINTTGGQIGERKIDLTYFQFPIGLKLHVIDLSFFKVSFVASVAAGVLMKGNETITHDEGKLRFPTDITGTYPSAQNDEFELKNPGYIVEYDGVLAPAMKNRSMSKQEDFLQFQLFGGLGFRSDWEITETWRVSFDLRGNVGLFEPRQQNHLKKIRRNEAIYEMDGARRDLFLSFNIGISRTLEIEPQEKERKMRRRSENKPRRPTRYPWPGPRNKKPKD
jgi:hypothetical protein